MQKILTPGTIRRTERIEFFIDEILRAWDKCEPPKEKKKFIKFAKAMRDLSTNSKGWSPNRKFMYYGSFPYKVWCLMNLYFGVEWRNKPEVAPVFWKKISNWRMRPLGGDPQMRPEWSMEDRDFSIPKCQSLDRSQIIYEPSPSPKKPRTLPPSRLQRSVSRETVTDKKLPS